MANLAEADAPKARYLVGEDAEYWMSLSDDDFEQLLSDSMTG